MRARRSASIAVVGILLVCGCVTNDFKVVSALSDGMTKEQAAETIHSYGFRLESAMDRPVGGWADGDESFDSLPARARRVERDLNRVVAHAQRYPVSHGLLGYGELYLFYDESGRLVRFYRWQIN